MTYALEADYLIVGAGAAGMAFADEVVRQHDDVEIVIVDRRATPGGHWNDAYPFVTLHQPARFYGVNSLPLGSNDNDLASGHEILAYYAELMDRLVATGQVTFLSRCQYRGDERVSSLEHPDQEYRIRVRDKVVDATYSNITVPATTPPRYQVDEEVELVPINALATLDRAWSHHTIIGAGKTGIDAVLYLLANGTDPACITWIVSNDSWMLNRASLLPENFSRAFPDQMRCIAQGSDVADIYAKLESAGHVFRLDAEVWPTRNRCATVSVDELELLRRVHHIVRKGRVCRVTPDRLVLARGEEPVAPGTLFVDCSADGLPRRRARPIFDAKRITLQPVVMCQPTLSAAAVGMFERRVTAEDKKNALCPAVPHPTMPEDFVVGVAGTVAAMNRWAPRYVGWFLSSRLSIGHHLRWWANLAFMFRVERWRRRTVANAARLLQSTEPASSTRAS